jgi:hypothetical protein
LAAKEAMKKLLIRIIGTALLACMFPANAGNNFNALDRNFARDYVVDVASGSVPNATLVTAFGYSANTGNVTNVNVWETADVWTALTAVSTMELLSSSANDAAAGTGCRSVLTQGLDANYNQISEFVTPNGTSVVALVNSYIVINNSTCVSAGSGNNNAGNITTRVTGAGSQQGYIAAGAGASRHGRFTVPAGYTLVLENFFLMGNKSGNPNSSVSTIVDIILPGGTRFQGLPLTIPNGSNPTITVPTGVVITEKQTIAFRIGSVSTIGIDISVGTSGVLVKNP